MCAHSWDYVVPTPSPDFLELSKRDRFAANPVLERGERGEVHYDERSVLERRAQPSDRRVDLKTAFVEELLEPASREAELDREQPVEPPSTRERAGHENTYCARRKGLGA